MGDRVDQNEDGMTEQADALQLGWLGTEAAKLLIERIDGGDGPVKILFLAPELVARGSTTPVAPKAVPDLPGEDGARDPQDASDSNTVPLRRGAARQGR